MKSSPTGKNADQIPIPEHIEDVTFTVKMEEQYLFDFFLYHAYSKLSGFLVNLLGMAVGFTGLFQYANHRISPPRLRDLRRGRRRLPRLHAADPKTAREKSHEGDGPNRNPGDTFGKMWYDKKTR